MDAPCKDCPDRTVTCHSECDKYRAYVAWRAEYRKKRAEERQSHSASMGMKKAMRIKQQREKQNRK